jgi:hypothetical protein
MSAVAKGVEKLVKGGDAKKVVEPYVPPAPAKSAAASAADETAAARRRARRGGRALLSEARLAPEQGVTTLGNTGV